MNLDEFRKAMESDATVENERLKRDLADVEKRYKEMSEEYTDRIQRLNSDITRSLLEMHSKQRNVKGENYENHCR